MERVIVVTPEELTLIIKNAVSEAIGSRSNQDDLELLDSHQAAEFLGISYDTLRICTKRKKNPLPLPAHGKITKGVAREWYVKFYNDYKSKHS
jgi:hypothetical protein